jgi:hypothetical protein
MEDVSTIILEIIPVHRMAHTSRICTHMCGLFVDTQTPSNRIRPILTGPVELLSIKTVTGLTMSNTFCPTHSCMFACALSPSTNISFYFTPNRIIVMEVNDMKRKSCKSA